MSEPLSYAQERTYFAMLFNPMASSPMYLGYLLSGKLDVAMLEWALRKLVERHDALRISLSSAEQGDFRQVVVPINEVRCDMVIEDHLEASKDELIARVLELCSGDAKNWSSWTEPLFRFRLVRGASGLAHLCLAFQHFVVDGRSLYALSEDFWKCCRAYAQNAGGDLEVPAASFVELVRSQRDKFDRMAARSKAFWADLIAGTSPVVQFGKPCEIDRWSGRHDERIIHVDFNELKRVAEVCGRVGATPMQWFTSAFMLAVLEMTDQAKITAHVQLDARGEFDADVVGMFTNTYPLAFDLNDPAGRSVFRQVRDGMVRAMRHQYVGADVRASPLVQLCEKWGVPTRFDIGVNHMKADRREEQSYRVEGIDVSEAAVALRNQGSFLYAIELRVAHYPDEADLTLVYNTTIFTPEMIDTLARRMSCYLRMSLDDMAVAVPDRVADSLFLCDTRARTTPLRNEAGIELLRVDLAEVASVLRRHSAVTDAVVEVHDEPGRESVLTATVIVGEPVTVDELRQHLYLAASASQFMIVPREIRIRGEVRTPVPSSVSESLQTLLLRELPDSAPDDGFWIAGGDVETICRIRAGAAAEQLPVPSYRVFSKGMSIQGISDAAAIESKD